MLGLTWGTMETKEPLKTLTYRKLVHPQDMNGANTLFGGRLMEWADEAAALYVMCQVKSKKIVTLKVSELLFKEPVKTGEFLEFYASTAKVGKTSITVKLEVLSKDLENSSNPREVLSCEMVFVTVDELGRPKSHGLSLESSAPKK